MSATPVAAPSVRSKADAQRAAAWVHYVTLAIGAFTLLYLARNQWFYFDEWDIIWPAEAARRFVEGHNGHWSSVPIAVWTAIQRTLGLGSYLPYIGVAIAAHLAVAHLLWRVLRRIRALPWVATSLITVFIFFGAAAENLMWAFQMGFMGAMAFGLGALLVALRPTLGIGGLVSVIILLTLGAATAGTSLPLFFVVAIVILYRHGWRTALIGVGVPSIIYLVWYVFIAGPNPTAIYRAQSVGEMLRGIPEFVAHMFVGAYDASTPVPGFGIVVITAIGLWVVLLIVGRKLTTEVVVATGMLASGVLFAALTAYSRLELGVGSAAESRYVYAVVIYTLPALALMLTLLTRDSIARLIAIISLIAIVFAFNVGTLISQAGGGATREVHTHELISAALELSQAHPGEIDPDSRPDPIYLPRTLAQLQSLEATSGLTRIPFADDVRLTALTNVGLNTAPSPDSSESCVGELQKGTVFTVDARGVVIDSPSGAALTLFARDGETQGASRTLDVPAGRTELTSVEPTTVIVEDLTAPITLCGQSSTS